MGKQVTALTMGAALPISVGAGTLAWHHMGRPDNWYKACTLGLMGGALMTYRYIDEI